MSEIKETEKNHLELWWYWIPSNKRHRKLYSEIDEDYYKPIRTKRDFNGNYIEYES